METIKSLALIIAAVVMGAFAFRVANTWDIPVDNQIAMALFGCFFYTIAFITAVVDIKNYLKKVVK